MKRPIPEDFAEVAPTMAVKKLRTHYNVGAVTLYAWFEETRSRRVHDRPAVPDDFAGLAASMCRRALERHYGQPWSVVLYWFRITGLTPLARPTRPVPDDFADIAPTMTRTAMIAHYRADIRTIGRWIKETGIQPLRIIPTPPRRQRGVYNITPTRSRPPGGNMMITRTTTIHEDAARVIGRHTPTYRCDERGRAKLDGKLWRVGNVICTPDELLARAARYERAA